MKASSAIFVEGRFRWKRRKIIFTSITQEVEKCFTWKWLARPKKTVEKVFRFHLAENEITQDIKWHGKVSSTNMPLDLKISSFIRNTYDNNYSKKIITMAIASTLHYRISSFFQIWRSNEKETKPVREQQ